ncbi:MAG: universal stress protein [Myxococcota bacterium]|nr:universal stress protein [Myxococcales bacterium]
MKIETILVPVDFSDGARAALDAAIDLAKERGARLHLLHCYRIDLGWASPYGVTLPPTLGDEIKQAASAELAKWTEDAVARGANAEAHLSSLLPTEGIERAAEQLGADLIVMGTKGLTGLKHVVLGSVAERTVRHAPCSVLTVKTA